MSLTTSRSLDSDTGAHPDTTRRTEEFVERLSAAALMGAELLTIELGTRLGLYQTLYEAGPVTVGAFADITGLSERYAREWLEQQATAGILDVVSPGDSAHREYLLPGAHVPVLLDPTNPFHFAGGPTVLEAIALRLPAVVEAYRTGAGVPFERFGAEMRDGLSMLNRPTFHHDLRSWIEELPDIVGRLEEGAVILDAGCGTGWSSIALARAFPASHVVAVDLDAASIEEARLNAEATGVADRIRFAVADAADASAIRRHLDRDAALVTVFLALHDMGEPVRALAAFGGVLESGGAVLVGDQRSADEFTVLGDPADRLSYAISVLHCLPATTAESRSVMNGMVLRASTVAEWAHAAGLHAVETLPIEHDRWRFYRLG